MHYARRVRRILLAILAFGLLSALPAHAQDYSDIWYKPGEDGWGVNVVQSDNFMFVTFFIYGSDKKPTWYTGQLYWDGSKFTGALYLTGGSWYAAPWNTGDNAVAQVGSATFLPSSANAYQATLTYTVTGVGTVLKNIERQTTTAIGLGGNYVLGQSGTYANCNNSANNGPYIDTGPLAVAQTVANLTLVFNYDSGAQCTLSGAYARNGLLFRMPNARYTCTGNLSVDTTALVYELKQTGQGLEGRFAAILPNGCREDAAFTGALR